MTARVKPHPDLPNTRMIYADNTLVGAIVRGDLGWYVKFTPRFYCANPYSIEPAFSALPVYANEESAVEAALHTVRAEGVVAG